MLYIISDGNMTVKASDIGAELQSIELSDHEFLYDGNGLWDRRAPILFPIVGRLQNNTYRYNGKEYQMGGHGFARDMKFSLACRTENSLTFMLTETAETLKIYPFRFVLTVKYEIVGDVLEVTYTVRNPDTASPLLYSIGAHEAYFCPMNEGKRFEDYCLEFETCETAKAFEVAPPLLSGRTYDFFDGSNTVPLKYGYFDVDAIVLKEHRSTRLTLREKNGDTGVEVGFADFPFLGIWTKPGANFLCIEPWCGVCDTAGVSGELTEKEGVITLPPRGEKSVTHTIKPIINSWYL